MTVIIFYHNLRQHYCYEGLTNVERHDNVVKIIDNKEIICLFKPQVELSRMKRDISHYQVI